MWNVQQIAPAIYAAVSTDGEVDKGRYATAEKAQKWADSLNAYEDDDFFRDDSYGSKVVSAEPEPEEEIGIDGQYEVGQEVAVEGIAYIIVKTIYISPEAAAFLDDANDVVMSVG